MAAPANEAKRGGGIAVKHESVKNKLWHRMLSKERDGGGGAGTWSAENLCEFARDNASIQQVDCHQSSITNHQSTPNIGGVARPTQGGCPWHPTIISFQ